MMSPTFIDHAYFYFNERRIVVADDEGYDETEAAIYRLCVMSPEWCGPIVDMITMEG